VSPRQPRSTSPSYRGRRQSFLAAPSSFLRSRKLRKFRRLTASLTYTETGSNGLRAWHAVRVLSALSGIARKASFAATTTAPPRPHSRRGRDPEARVVPGTVTVALCSRTNASPFWIMLLLVWGRSEHGMISPQRRLPSPFRNRAGRSDGHERFAFGTLD